MPGSLTVEARRYQAEVEKRRQLVVASIRRMPIAALIWGPSTTKSKTGKARAALRDALIDAGHLAQFSEDLVDSSLKMSVQAQEAAHVEAHDITFSIPDSAGSIAEIHDFAKLPLLSGKIVTFVDLQWNKGYANQSLLQLQTTATCRIIPYESHQIPDFVIKHGLDLVGRLQELHYMLGRRP